MRQSFAAADMVIIDRLRRSGTRMENLCNLFRHTYSRDMLVEAIDALRRHPRQHGEATQHVNRVLAAQQMGMQLVNGRIVHNRPEPMF